MTEDKATLIPVETTPIEVLVEVIHNFRAPLGMLDGYAMLTQQDANQIENSIAEIRKIIGKLQLELQRVQDYLQARKDAEI